MKNGIIVTAIILFLGVGFVVLSQKDSKEGSYDELRTDWNATDPDTAKKLGEASFIADVSNLQTEVLMKCSAASLNNGVLSDIAKRFVTIKQTNVIKQNCGPGASQSFEISVLSQDGIDCSAIITDAFDSGIVFSGCEEFPQVLRR